MKDHILVKDNLLSADECHELINTYSINLEKSKKWQSYNYYDIEDNNFQLLSKKINVVLHNEYITNYPEIDLTSSPWSLTSLRIKHFPPGKSFSNWHSEHSFRFKYI